jgi:hypothetical protein
MRPVPVWTGIFFDLEDAAGLKGPLKRSTGIAGSATIIILFSAEKIKRVADYFSLFLIKTGTSRAPSEGFA